MFGKYTFKFSWIPFAGIATTSCSVFVQLHSFPLFQNRPMKHGINSKHFGAFTRRGYYISCPVSSLVCWRFWSPVIESHNGMWRSFQILSVRFGKIIARAFWKLRQFSKRVVSQKKTASVLVPVFRTREFCMCSLSLSQLSYHGSMLTSKYLKCLWVSTCLIFNPWWIFSPCNMFMCTNKTCFAGVGT